MGENTSIEWTDNTFNHIWGCTHVHDGCRNCYAETWAKRFGVKWGPSGVRRVASEKQWTQPVRWNRQAERAYDTAQAQWVADCCVGYKSYPEPQPEEFRVKVFCASMADVFEEWSGEIVDNDGRTVYVVDGKFVSKAPGQFFLDDRWPATMDDVRKRLFKLIDSTPWLDWQLVTKRPENIIRMWPRVLDASGPNGELETICEYRENVWLLTSISDQASADKQIPELLKCRDLSPVLGLSCEPLLGPICDVVSIDEPSVDWVIVGGESGSGARPMHPDWVRSIRNQCQMAGVPFLYKQWGEWKPLHGDGWPHGDEDDEGPSPWTWITTDGELHQSGSRPDAVMQKVGKKVAGRILDGRTWDEFPRTEVEA